MTPSPRPDRPVLSYRLAERPRHPGPDRAATVLADAMLAGAWTLAGLTSRIRHVGGSGRRPWHADLAGQVLAGYPAPPVDRPGELAAFVAACPALPPGHPVRGGRGLALPAAMPENRFGGPVLDDDAALADYLEMPVAELIRLADVDGRTRRARAPELRHYRYRWVSRRSGARLWEIPRPRLRSVQVRLLRGVLDGMPAHPAAHGFVRGRSAVTAAAHHTGADAVICLDLASFFAAVTAGRVWGALRAAGYPEPVSHLITGLLTHAVPASVIGAMPPGPDGTAAFRLRRYLARPHLPQGAPSSPSTANLVCWSLDRRLSAYAQACGARYTRYADDLTFSGGPDLARSAGRLVTAVGEIVRQEGFRLNAGKTRVRRRHQRQEVMGIVVNAGTRMPRPEADRLRAVLHDCAQHGPDRANRGGHPDFRAHLLGRIGWATQLDPARGRRLRAQFERIEWG